MSKRFPFNRAERARLQLNSKLIVVLARDAFVCYCCMKLSTVRSFHTFILSRFFPVIHMRIFLKVFLSVSHITDLVANLLQSCERSCVLADVLVFSGLYALSKNDTYKTGCNNVGTLMPNPGE